MNIKPPYLLCLGDAIEKGYIKTAQGILDWQQDKCLGQLRFEGCTLDLGIEDMSLKQAKQAGVKTLILGVAPAGGRLPDTWLPILEQALTLGINIASGLHDKLNDIPTLKELAEQTGTKLQDIRYFEQTLDTGSGIKRSGKRLITVGTDCAVGKKYTALAIYKEMQQQQVNVDFRATGQTGIMISGQGIPIDSTISDFTSGAAESLSPNNSADHWDIIEGQGAYFHPAYAGVTVALIHGSQPDYLVLCHEAGRKGLLGLEYYPVPAINDCIKAYEQVAQLTNPNAKVIGLSVNTSQLAELEAKEYLHRLKFEYGLICTDPFRFGVVELVEYLLDK